MKQPASETERRLAALGLELPPAAAPVANYVPGVLTGSLLFISGQLPMSAAGALAPQHKGKLGADVSEAAGREAAALCALNLLAQAAKILDGERGPGGLDKIVRCVRLGGFINSAENFTNLAAVMNGASDLMASALGENGRHARSTIGVAQLPLGACVEVEAVFEVAP
jgi:enamine deaminase RidA (YjgF/YER057c/UK114 family)